ncbi:DUF3077 domain-containing protein [Pseudomonas sp. CCI1.2]|uniref:DUF6124 family protein n=1 Tax=unclassified Pseudomonas TaxID=196821 RepID=UPI002AC8E349|nr:MULTISPECIES: DUF3077 domain-containing protein [unclassified Pseudomonas]MEB0094392.1 DUF3077 domain-containing protein [Pseudomonas sp. CCI4.2]MEB0122915.1 DUF3077 domain-containing protein [Pseudomonas sp. CCI1.2]WPX55201.1 DUF3077 domain-containing protein [Pseudomonas sp. CCI4.2]
MTKITPDPPHSNRNRVTPRTSRITQQNLPDRLFHVREYVSAEEALTTACEILDCAAATAYESAEKLDAPSRKLVLAVVYLVETAQELLESALAADGPKSAVQS